MIPRPSKAIQPPLGIHRKLHPSRRNIPIRPLLHLRIRSAGDILYGKRLKDIVPDDRVKSSQVVLRYPNRVQGCHHRQQDLLLCLYLRIFIQPVFRRICYCAIAFLSAWGLAYILDTFFHCTLVDAYWGKTIMNKTCVNSKARWLSYAVINIVYDVAILALLVYPVSQLHLARGKNIYCAGSDVRPGDIAAPSPAQSGASSKPTSHHLRMSPRLPPIAEVMPPAPFRFPALGASLRQAIARKRSEDPRE
ncbi:uncharacterized protein NFIA_062170 [Aspergillus fischeri NRRL 181]|uniref:Rhodopsin domain-containing protein n=1 Tax=Neosartorya fischeri (strain ATCC 1020 / DSM 3700 / CBS 544.65 / FGSC A1164 / JCM 1740 / NRRL 181 / WB 181) TaxID=331117 RepID=A1D5R2_NEOFI|nr:uncharacterized protein NFIA_062170 [Aspergillus fischeri NRRL 181]EAW21056.1 hypothetical protein NFIA_062170 [Aspergillus fischeri NRRL 181]KAG2019220.1 hypothetical protein GB937_005133 [Aspergillus fischeri]